MKITRREFIFGALLTGTVIAVGTRMQLGFASLGAATEVTGRVTVADLAAHQGRLEVDTGGELWSVDIGEPKRNREAGLNDAMIAPGRQITVFGIRDRDDPDRRMIAEAVVTGGHRFAVLREKQIG